MDSLSQFGAVALVVLVFWLAKCLFDVIYIYGIGPIVNKVDFKSKGKWALVTGSTDGIGKEYAKALAARGCDIILVSRSMDKLRATAEEIEKEFNVQTKVIEADFFKGEEIYARIAEEIADLEIGTLVNNAGISYSYPEYFLELPEWVTFMSNLIQLNVISVTRMTKLVLPDMVKRGKGIVINLGSATSIVPSPMLLTYVATKAYVDKFTEGLNMEYGKKGIIIQCAKPYYVCTKMTKIRQASVFVPSAKTFVESAISLVGTASNTIGYLPHACKISLIKLACLISTNCVVNYFIKSTEPIRDRAIMKYTKLYTKNK